MGLFNKMLTFDFGSSNTVVCEDGKVVFDEPTEIAIWSPRRYAIGRKARCFYSDNNYELIKPVEGGQVVNPVIFELYVSKLVRTLVGFPRLRLKTVLVAAPDEMVVNGKLSLSGRAFVEPFRKIGVKDIRVIQHSVAVYVGLKSVILCN